MLLIHAQVLMQCTSFAYRFSTLHGQVPDGLMLGAEQLPAKMRKEHRLDAVQMYNAPANIKPQAIEEPKIG